MIRPEQEVADIVEDKLREFQLLGQYPKEEPDLLDHVEQEISDVLGSEYAIVTQSWDQSGPDFVSAFGHSFWPDIIVRRGNTELLALELKLAKSKSSTTAKIAQMIGQCLIYRAKYPQVIGFLVKYVHYADCGEDTKNVRRRVNDHDIRIVIRQA